MSWPRAAMLHTIPEDLKDKLFGTADKADCPPGYSVVKEESDKDRIRMLEQMVDGLVEENARKDEEILRLRNELDRKK